VEAVKAQGGSAALEENLKAITEEMRQLKVG